VVAKVEQGQASTSQLQAPAAVLEWGGSTHRCYEGVIEFANNHRLDNEDLAEDDFTSDDSMDAEEDGTDTEGDFTDSKVQVPPGGRGAHDARAAADRAEFKHSQGHQAPSSTWSNPHLVKMVAAGIKRRTMWRMDGGR